MSTFILILFSYVGPLGATDSNALASVPGFKTQAECVAAGNAASALANGTTKVIRFACVKQS